MKRKTVSIIVAVLAVGIIGVFAVSRMQTKADTVPVMSDNVEVAQNDVVEETEQETEQAAPVEPEQDSTEPEEVDVAQEEPETIDEALTDITALDKTMYATSAVNTRSGPSTDYERVGGLTTNEEVHVTGQSNLTLWFRIDVDGVTQFVSNNYLADAKVEVQPSKTETQVSQSETPSSNNDSRQLTNDEAAELLGLPSGGGINWDGTIFEGYGGTSILDGIEAE